MPRLELTEKLAVLADAAKYDASCASSGSERRSSAGKTGGIGSITGAGICHSYAPDGRCISLLKLLLTNHCIYDCLYCVNRVSSDVPAGAVHAGGGRQDHPRLLSPQSHRRPGFCRPASSARPTIRWNRSSASRAACGTTTGFAAISISRPSPMPTRASSNRPVSSPTACRSTSSCRARESLKKLAPQKEAGSIRRAMAGLRLRLEEAGEEKRKNPARAAFRAGRPEHPDDRRCG